jgi:hypothetical protein
MKQFLQLIQAAFLLGIMFSSCTSVKNSALSNQLNSSNCNQQNVYAYTRSELPYPIHELSIDTAITELFTPRVLNTVNATGLLDIVKDYTNGVKTLRQNNSLENRIRVLELSQKIDRKINIADLEISAIASEIDCEKERSGQLASYLKAKEDNAASNLTVAAIVVGATGAIAAGVLLAKESETKTAEIVGIGTGITEATLGMMILLNTRKVEFYHKRNVLSDIWYGPEVSTVFPASIWYHLNYDDPENIEQSLRLQIVEKWMNFEQIADVKEKNKEALYELFFGEGGKYTSEQLSNRARMYEQIEAQVNLMMQDLKELSVQLEMIDRK